MLITTYKLTTYKPSSEAEVPYHLNPYAIVGVRELGGRYYVDIAGGATQRIDRESYERIIAWLEQAR